MEENKNNIVIYQNDNSLRELIQALLDKIIINKYRNYL